MKYLLKIRYCGEKFAGFQVQDNAPTVQGALSAAAKKIFTVDASITGCSRTDSGVHALEYYATLAVGEGASSVPPEKLPRALMSALPSDIAVTEAREVPEDLSVRRAVTGKRYMYKLFTKEYLDPFEVGRACHYPKCVDIEKINRAAAHFVGTHDFRAFMASGSEVKTTVRTVSECFAEKSGDEVRIYVAADGFLYNMVRIIVGTLMYVNEGKISADDIGDIIASGERERAGKTAPPDGLYLEKVFIEI